MINICVESETVHIQFVTCWLKFPVESTKYTYRLSVSDVIVADLSNLTSESQVI